MNIQLKHETLWKVKEGENNAASCRVFTNRATLNIGGIIILKEPFLFAFKLVTVN